MTISMWGVSEELLTLGVTLLVELANKKFETDSSTDMPSHAYEATMMFLCSRASMIRQKITKEARASEDIRNFIYSDNQRRQVLVVAPVSTRDRSMKLSA